MQTVFRVPDISIASGPNQAHFRLHFRTSLMDLPFWAVDRHSLRLWMAAMPVYFTNENAPMYVPSRSTNMHYINELWLNGNVSYRVISRQNETDRIFCVIRLHVLYKPASCCSIFNIFMQGLMTCKVSFNISTIIYLAIQ